MKFLIVGIGNIGVEYHHTRHNMGFDVLDAMAEMKSLTFSTERYADVLKMRLKNKELLLIKPSTYVNLSGNAVRYWMQKENIPLERVLIVVDDLSLPYGTLRMKTSGSDAGHNGLKHICQVLASSSYPRLRCGIGNAFDRGQQVDYVLGRYS